MPETWKDTKREYLLMLIRDGDLSNSNLDDMTAGVQHMIRRHNKYLPVPSTVEDMRRIVEAYQAKGVEQDCPTCRWDCEEGNDHPQWGTPWLHNALEQDIGCPVWEQHNANPKYALIPDGMAHEQAVQALELADKYKKAIQENGLSAEEAVRYLEHGPEMVEWLKLVTRNLSLESHGIEIWNDINAMKELIAKMEGK